MARAVAPRGGESIVRPLSSRFLPTLFLVAAAAASLRGQGAVWVSPSGNDANAGTEERPLKTLEGARDLVRTMNADMKDDITVFISGEFHLHNPVRFGPRDSGTNGYSIIYTAAPDAHPIFSGGLDLTGWTPGAADAAAWSAPAVNQGDRIWAGTANIAFIDGNPAELESPETGQGGYLYKPRKGEDIGRIRVILAASQGLLVISGTEDSPVRGLVFKDIGFKYSAGDAAVLVAYAVNIQFLEDRFLDCVGAAIKIGRADAVTIDTALFGNLGTNAILAADATNLRISQSRFASVGGLSPPGQGVVLSLRNSTAMVDHCLFQNYPTIAIKSDGGSVAKEANLEQPPVIPFHGDQPAPATTEGAGLSPYNRTLVDERIASIVPPDPPALVRAIAIGRSAIVTWMPSGLSGGEPYDHFTVTASTGAVVSVPAVDFFRTGYATITNLESGRPVAFIVTASTGAGESMPSLASAEVNPKRRFRPEMGGQPRVSVDRRGNEITLIMSPPQDGRVPIVAYNVSIGGQPAVHVQGLDLWTNNGQGPVIRDLPVPAGAAGGIAVFAVGAGAEHWPMIGINLQLPVAQTPNPGR